MAKRYLAAVIAATIGVGLVFGLANAGATGKGKGTEAQRERDYHYSYIHGAPADPSRAWQIARGGRLYDNWYATLDQSEPETTHPLWPASNTQKSGATTWRCKSCHGWDYKGRDGMYGAGSYQTGISGVAHLQGKDPADIVRRFSGKAHGFAGKLSPDALNHLGLFLSRGLHDTDRFIERASKAVKGDERRGQGIFQNVCAACHGFEGRALNWGDDKDPGYVGTEASANPWEVLHKIRNGHPGVEMVALRSFDFQQAVDVLAYAKTLPKR